MAVQKKKKSKQKKRLRFTTWKDKLQNWKVRAFDFGLKMLKNNKTI
uniref:50S ribosomal protein L32 n=1 Tax=Codium simulans TaxID=589376 RepID=A0A1I9LKG5_9CHLO|nr:50S ribosomal protein L32 [Codium simulans]ANJ70826.1 50S ribosomal protein L32 [Codium simulans]